MKILRALLLSLLILAMPLLPALSAVSVKAAGTNLISNPSLESPDPANPAQPLDWSQGNWGTNTTNFSYLTTSGHSGSASGKVQITSYTNGDAKWFFKPVAITAGSQYTFSDYYQANIGSSLVAQFDNGSGSYTYQDLATPTASPTGWNQATVAFTAPSTAKFVTIFHLINAVGWLQTDDFSLTAVTASAPVVSLTAPAAGSTVSGTVQLSANASDTNGIAGVQFKVDGVNIGSEVAAAPYQLIWDSSTVSNGTHNLTATARNTLGTTTTSTAVQVNVSNSNPTPPSGNLITNPSVETVDASNPNQPLNWQTGNWGTNTTTFSYLNGSAHTGSRSVKVQTGSYTSGDAKWYFVPVTIQPNTQYKFTDYYQSNIPSSLVAQFDNGSGSFTYQTLANVPASATWQPASVTFTAPATAQHVTIFHLINAVGWLQLDDASLSAVTTPTVSITNPAANATVSGNVTIAASAGSPTGVTSVQFTVDGANTGSPVTTTPYQLVWDSTKVSNGSHSFGATVTAKDGQTAKATSVSVTVNNQATGSGNFVPNPSVETVDPGNSKQPLNWSSGSWGSNTVSFAYATSGHTGSRSVKTTISKYSSGSAYWFFNEQPVTGGQMYDFRDYYKSNILSEIDAGFTMNDGSTQYLYLGDPSPSPNSWTKFETQFTAPVGAVSMTIFHNIYSVGWLQTDDYSLQTFAYQGFNRPLISLTFDDGYASFYNNGLPLLKKYGLTSTDYIITGSVNNDPAYMTTAMLKGLYASGNEIASHTVTHPDLTTLSATNMDNELKNSQAQLQSWLGVPIVNFASPYGAYNQQVVTDAQKYYRSYRGVEAGYNAKNNFDQYHLMVQNMLSTTTLAQVQGWVNQAKATNTWLILVYHQVDPSTASGDYNTYPSDLDAQLAAIKSSGVTVKTVNQALDELLPQLP